MLTKLHLLCAWLCNVFFFCMAVHDKATPIVQTAQHRKRQKKSGRGREITFLRMHLSFAVPYSQLAFVVRHSPIPEVVGGMLGHPRVRKSSGCVRSDWRNPKWQMRKRTCGNRGMIKGSKPNFIWVWFGWIDPPNQIGFISSTWSPGESVYKLNQTLIRIGLV